MRKLFRKLFKPTVVWLVILTFGLNTALACRWRSRCCAPCYVLCQPAPTCGTPVPGGGGMAPPAANALPGEGAAPGTTVQRPELQDPADVKPVLPPANVPPP